MVFKITKKTTREELNAWFANLPPSKVNHLNAKPFNATKFSGKLKRKLDGLAIQKKLRNEGNKISRINSNYNFGTTRPLMQ
jgi:hypothetical protein